MGTRPHVAGHVASWIRSLYVRSTVGGQSLGRVALFDRIRDYASLPGIRAAGDHRHPGDLILDFGCMAITADVEIAQSQAGSLLRSRFGGSFSLEVFVG